MRVRSPSKIIYSIKFNIFFLLIIILSYSVTAATINPSLVDPSTSISVGKDQLFNITTSVTCNGGACSGIVAKLDPVKPGAAQVYIEPEVEEILISEDTVPVIIVFNEENKQTQNDKIKIKPDLKNRKNTISQKQDKLLAKFEENNIKDPWYVSIFSKKPDNFKLSHKYKTVNAVAGILSEEGLDLLREDPDIDSIVLVEEVEIDLLQSIPLINADDAWNLDINGSDFKGAGQTACVVDTGVNSSHPGLGGRVVAEKCYCSYGGACCPDATTEDDFADDDQGHGTHCAGIIAADYGSYKGVAPEANIVAVKSLDLTGRGWSSDIISGIDWCVDNADTYNISVISLSLGGSQYKTTCDAQSAAYANAIDAATAQGIAVFAASGNDANYTAINSPACVTNAISVGAVYDAAGGMIAWSECTDLSRAVDQQTCFTNSAGFLDMLAPGAITTSLDYDGTTTGKGGTSMACPMAAGAGVLLKQYYKNKYGYNITPSEIKQKLILSGEPIDDPFTSRFYPRINLENMVEKGVIPEEGEWNGVDPFYTISSNPENGSCLSSLGDGQSCNTTWIVNATQEGTWEFFTIYEMDDSQVFTAKFNVTVDVEHPNVTLIFPIDQSYLNPDQINFSYMVDSSFSISSCSLVIDSETIMTNNSISKLVPQYMKWTNPSGGELDWGVICTDSRNISNTVATESVSVIMMSGYEGGSTNLSEVDIENISNLVIEKNDFGVINFSEPVNLSGGGDLNQYISFDLNLIEIDSDNLPALNKSAELIIRNITYHNPIIMRDGEECGDCVILEEGSDYVRFSVTQFSSYSVGGSSVEEILTGRLYETTAGNLSAEGGNVTQVNLTTNVSTDRWQGYYGNVSGSLAFGYGSYVFYNFGGALEYAVYASQNQTFDFYSMESATAADIDSVWSYNLGNDQAVDIFTGPTTNISGVVAPSVELNPPGQNFNSTILDDGNSLTKSGFAFGAIVQKSGTCFDGTVCDYELIVPADGLETYYMFLEVG